jgi:hypothetical protein
MREAVEYAKSDEKPAILVAFQTTIHFLAGKSITHRQRPRGMVGNMTLG